MFIFFSYMASLRPAKDPRKNKRTEKAVARMVFIDWDWVWGGVGGGGDHNRKRRKAPTRFPDLNYSLLVNFSLNLEGTRSGLLCNLVS